MREPWLALVQDTTRQKLMQASGHARREEPRTPGESWRLLHMATVPKDRSILWKE
jgi:hypothetical protein